MEDIKPVVAVKYDFACRDQPKVIAYFGTLGLSRFCFEEKMNGLICQWTSTSFQFSAQTKMEDTKPLVTENEEF